MIRLLIFALLLYFGYRVVKSLGSSLLGSKSLEDRGNTAPAETDLIQDPQCGTYFLRQRGVQARIGGETIAFCSPACRDAYLKRREAGGR